MRAGAALNDPKSQLLYAGTYQADYPRNRLMIEALNRAGFAVLEVSEPVWDAASAAGSNADGWFGWNRARLIAEFMIAYPRLAWRVGRHLRHAAALVIGYPGQLDLLVLGPLAKLWRKPVMFNPLVTLTDMIIEDRALVDGTSVVGRCIRLVDRLALRLADLVIVDTRANGAYLTERFGIQADKIIEIPVGADATIFDPVRFPSAAHSPRQPRRVLFYGKYIPLHGIDTILRAARILQDTNAAVVFELIGNGQTYTAMRRLAEDLALTNVRFVEPVPYLELPGRIAVADIVLGIFGETTKASRVVPNKVFQAMAMGAAIITRRSPDVERVLRHGDSAILVSPGSPAELAEAILLLQNEHLRTSLGQAARHAFDRFASPDVLAAKAGDSIRRVLHPNEQPERPLEFGASR